MKLKVFLCFLLVTSLQAFAARAIVDELGRKLSLPDHPHRLICLSPSLADSVYQLGAGDDVVAVSDFTKYPTAAAKKPSIGLPLKPSLEKIIALHPDLVLGLGDLNEVENLRPLEKYGIPVFLLNSHGLSGIYSSLSDIGKALNRESAAQALIARLQAREKAIRSRAVGKPAVRVFMPIWHDPVITIGRPDYLTDMIRIAGGVSVTEDITLPWPHISLEAVVARDPDALLLVRNGKMSVGQLATHPGWSMLRAIRTGKVYMIDDRIELPSPIAFDALEDLARQFHP